MSNSRTWLFPAVALSVTLGFFLLASREPEKVASPQSSLFDVARSSIEVGEDLEARDRFEWMQLHDPATGRIPEGIRPRELLFARTLPKKIPGLLKGLDPVNTTVVNWKNRGPYNVGGRTRALALDITDPQIILAGGVSGGMWRSENGGLSWDKKSVDDGLQSVSSIVQDRRPGRTATWYYGTGELRGNSAAGGGGTLYRGDGIYKSTDNGQTWTRLSATSTNNVLFDQHFDYVWNLALSRTDTVNTRLVAATIGGILSSTDGGATWTTTIGTLSNNAGPRYTDVTATSTGVFYATCSSRNINLSLTTTGAGIYRSTDGVNWTAITPPSWPSDYNRIVVAASPSDPTIVYFMGEAPPVQPTNHVLWKYTYLGGDGSGSGGQWIDRSQNLPDESGASGARDGNAKYYSQTSYDLVMAVHPTNPNVIFVGAVNLYRADDAFATPGKWTRIGGYASPSTYARYENNHPDHHALAFHPANTNMLYNGNDGGVFVTSASSALTVAWTPLNNGFVTTQFYSIALDRDTRNDASILGGMQDNGTWVATDADPFNPWLEQFSGDGGFCAFASAGSIRYVSTQQTSDLKGPIFRLPTSSTGGRVDPSGLTVGLFINPYILDPANADRMYVGGGTSVWRCDKLSAIPMGSSSPATAGWTNMTNTGTSGATVTALALSKLSPNVLYFGTSNARVYRVNDANNGDPSAADISTGKGFPTSGYVSSIAVDPFDAGKVLLAFSNYAVRSLFYTTNSGQSWSDVSSNLEAALDGTGNGPSVRWVAMLPGSDTYYYLAGTSIGLYSTRQLNGNSTIWAQEGPSTVATNVVTMLDVRGIDGTVVVGTHGGGVFSASIPVVPPVPPPPVVIPRAFALSKSFPNPFNTGTKFELDIARPGFVTLRIVDMSGRTVAVPLSRNMTAGSKQSVAWDGRTMEGRPASSGVYVALMEAVGSVSATKILLLR